MLGKFLSLEFMPMEWTSLIGSILFVALAIKAHRRLKEAEYFLKHSTFPHHEWDKTHSLKDLSWNSPGEPQEIAKSRLTESSYQRTIKMHYQERAWSGVLTLLSLGTYLTLL
jgi:hypothetical protein